MSIIDLRNDPSFGHYYKSYPNIQIKLENDTFYYRNKCPCGEYINWFGHVGYLHKYKYALQCENCDPSDDTIALYEWNGDCWTLIENRIKCQHNGCNSYLKKKYDQRWTDVIQCQSHNPSTKFTKYAWGYYDIGWEIRKIKAHNGKRHIWKNCTYETVDYICPCGTCKN